MIAEKMLARTPDLARASAIAIIAIRVSPLLTFAQSLLALSRSGGGRISTISAAAASSEARRAAAPTAAFVGVRSSLGPGVARSFAGGDFRHPASLEAAADSATRLTASLGFEPSPQDDGGDDALDALKWERMYRDGERAREAAAKSLFGESDDVNPSSASRTELRVITWDLDNTLWRTGAVIGAANDALSEYLAEKGVVTPVRTEVVMGELFKRDKARYCPYMEEEVMVGANGDDSGDGVDNVGKSSIYIQSGSHKPVLLTQLRKDAIADILVRHNGYGESEAVAFAEEAFGVWTAARHGAIPDHMAESVLDVFRQIASLRTSTGERPVVGAITDGNSDPRTVPALGEYFDFVVNSESVGVAKPDRRVYYAAVKEVASLPAVADLFGPGSAGGRATAVVDDDGNLNEDAVEDVIGPWWCHIGDDFIKDCVAAKELKMRSVWCRELVLPLKEEGEISAAGEDGSSESPKTKKKRDVADLVKELAEMKVVEMSIGAEDFLADSIHREFADAILDRFGDLGDTLARWHEEGLAAAAVSDRGMGTVSKSISAEDMEAIADVLEVVVPDEPPETPALQEAKFPPSVHPAGSEASQSKRETKFCMFCGAKLPIEARFCSACGEKQPEFNQ